MKTLSFLMVSLFVCLMNFANPVSSNAVNEDYTKTLPDLSKDRDFVQSVNHIFSLLGNTDIAVKENSFKEIYASVLALKKRYAVLGDQSKALPLINAGIDKLVKQGKIAKQGINFVCVRQLYADVVACIRTSTSYSAFVACIQDAYDEFRACLEED